MNFPASTAKLTLRVGELTKGDFMMSFSQAAGQNDAIYWYPEEPVQIVSAQLVAGADHAGDMVMGSIAMYPKELDGNNLSLWYTTIHYLDGKYQSNFQRFSNLIIQTGSKIGFSLLNTDSASASTMSVRVRSVPEVISSQGGVVYVQQAKSPCGIMDFLGGNCNV